MAAEALSRRIAALRDGQPEQTAFAGVFLAALLCFLAVGAVLPVLPRYVTGPVGAGDLAVGVVIGAFAVSAVIGRPIGGRLADVRGRRQVAVWGLSICVLAGALLFVPWGVPWLIFARLVLGLGDGWVFTAGVTWAVDLAPEARRGQAIGVFGLAVWGGLTAGSLLGELLYRVGSFEAVWAFATLSPLAGVAVARIVPEAFRVPQEHPRALRFPRAAMRPGAALALANVGYGTVAGFVVLHLDARGVSGGGAVFTTFAASVVVTRLAAGRLPDRIGPVRCAVGAGLAEAAGLGLLAAAGSLPVALVAGVVTGAGFSLLFPSLALLVMRDVSERDRGIALGAFTSFFDVGVGLGAPLAGAIAALAGYPEAFWVAAAAAACGALLGVAGQPRPPVAQRASST